MKSSREKVQRYIKDKCKEMEERKGKKRSYRTRGKEE